MKDVKVKKKFIRKRSCKEILFRKRKDLFSCMCIHFDKMILERNEYYFIHKTHFNLKENM